MPGQDPRRLLGLGGGEVPEPSGVVMTPGDQPLPSGLIAAAVTGSVCPARTRDVLSGSAADEVPRAAQVLSSLPVTSHLPSGLIATA